MAHPRGSISSSQPNTEGSNDGFISGEFERDEPDEALAQVKASKNITPRVGGPGAAQPHTQAEGAGGTLTTRRTAVVSDFFVVQADILINRQMGVTLTWTPVAMMSTGSRPPQQMPKRSRRPRYTVADLPFPRGGKDAQTWRRLFVPSLLAWAGSQDDPFGTNSQMDTEIDTIWQHIYPAIALNDATHEILQNVVRASSID